MSETLEASIALSTESELFHALHKLSTENFSDQSQHLQHQMITFGFFQTMKFNYGNSFSSK
jgi:hypothetical protein